MLYLELHTFGAIFGPHMRYRGTVECMATRGPVSDFAVRLFDEGTEPVASGWLLGYPRWSESLLGLVARAIGKAMPGAFDVVPPSLPRLSLDVRIGHSLQAEVGIEVVGGILHCDGREVRAIEGTPCHLSP